MERGSIIDLKWLMEWIGFIPNMIGIEKIRWYVHVVKSLLEVHDITGGKL